MPGETRAFFMTKDEILYTLRYINPNCLWVVTWRGKLTILYTPYRVKVLKKVGDLTKGSIQIVTKIKLTTKGTIAYCIGENLYHHNYFDILVK